MPEPTDVVTATKLAAHEQICAERYTDIKESFGRVHDRLDKIIYGLIGLLIAMVAWFLTNNPPWKSAPTHIDVKAPVHSEMLD